MKTHVTFGIAAGFAALVAAITTLVPSLTTPVFTSYVIGVLCFTAVYDYTRGRHAHRYF